MAKKMILPLLPFLLSLAFGPLAMAQGSECPVCRQQKPPCWYQTGTTAHCFCHFTGKSCVLQGNPCSCDFGNPPLCTCSAAAAKAAGSETASVKPNASPTAEQIRAQWVKIFKDDPKGQLEVFHVGGAGCMGQEAYVLGMTQAAFDTGHGIYFTHGVEDSTPDRTNGGPIPEVKLSKPKK